MNNTTPATSKINIYIQEIVYLIYFTKHKSKIKKFSYHSTKLYTEKIF